MASMTELKHRVGGALKQFYITDMRWSYYAILGVIVAGVVINIVWPHLWQMWPFLFAVAVLSVVHEAAERNGQGVPPLYAYGFLVGILVFWTIVIALFSFVNPVVLGLGIIGLGYQCTRGWLQEREREKLIETRRAQGRCIHCGEFADSKKGVCDQAAFDGIDGVEARAGADCAASCEETVRGEGPTAEAVGLARGVFGINRRDGGRGLSGGIQDRQRGVRGVGHFLGRGEHLFFGD